MDLRLAEKRLKAGVHAAAATLLIFAGGTVLLNEGLRWIRPSGWNEDAMFSWSLASDLVGFAMACVFVLMLAGAAVYGAWTLRFKPVLIVSTVVVLIGAASDFAVARDYGVGIWPDRITIRDDGVARDYRPADVAQVEAWCGYQRIDWRRRQSFATVNYELVFRDGRRIGLSSTRPGNREKGLEWLRTIESFDQVWGAHAPKVEPVDSDGFGLTRPLCAQALKAELAAKDFVRARRLLGWSDDHMRRLGLGPREPW